MAVGFERAFPGAAPEQIGSVLVRTGAVEVAGAGLGLRRTKFKRLADGFEEFFQALRPVDELGLDH